MNSAWKAIQRNARTSKSLETKKEIAIFEADARTNLDRISRLLQQRKFVFPSAKGIKIPKDKGQFRPLVVAKVESRIVQRAVHDVLISVPEIRQYIRTPYSFGGVKKDKNDSISAVPAAIEAVLIALGDGCNYFIKSDISSFFTKISKTAVTSIVSRLVGDNIEFMELFTRAIHVELENMAKLSKDAHVFPIENIGVAQGNSLSPLMGNILLFDFDRALNDSEDVRCIRYIDDFIILAPNKQVAENKFQQALHLLSGLGMTVSRHKTVKGSVKDGFEFLGVEFANGLLRPSSKSRDRVISSINKTFYESRAAFRDYIKLGYIDRQLALIQTLTKVSGIMQGWGAHYWFCKDDICFKNVDVQIEKLIRDYLGSYRDERDKANGDQKWRLLGIEPLSGMERRPFHWPKKGQKYISERTPSAPPVPIIVPGLTTPPWD